MKKKLLSISLALPILVIGAGKIWANLKVIPGNLQLSQATANHFQAKLDIKQHSQFYVAARDEKEKKQECEWRGICSGDQ
jgi:sulfatase maturation enzyme AslB (radical SAM superfamily)